MENEAAKANKTTIELIDKMHREAFHLAAELDKPSAMTSAAKNLADLYGFNKTNQKIVTDDGEGGDAPIGPVVILPSNGREVLNDG